MTARARTPSEPRRPRRSEPDERTPKGSGTARRPGASRPDHRRDHGPGRSLRVGVDRTGRRAVRRRLAAPDRRAALARDRERARAPLRPAARVPPHDPLTPAGRGWLLRRAARAPGRVGGGGGAGGAVLAAAPSAGQREADRRAVGARWRSRPAAARPPTAR